MALVATAFFSQTTVEFILIGSATGALYALMALGILLTYRASGVLNFSVGSLGAVSAFLFYSLRDDHGVGWAPALILALLVGALIGVLTQVLVMGVLRRVSLLGKLIATLGLMTLGQGFVNVVFKPTQILSPNTFLPSHLVKLSSQIVIPESQLWLIGIALVIAIGLRAAYSKTTFGLATSAVAESPRVAAASGWSPTVIELINFSLAGVLSALAAVLLTPLVGLDPTVLTLVMLPSLAAALVGRFSSFSATVAAALGIGVVSSELGLFQTNIASLFHAQASTLGDLPDVVPLLIIIVATAVRGRGRLQRGEILTRLPLPGSGRIRVVPLLAFAVVGILLMLVCTPNWQATFLVTLGMGIIVLSVVVLTGYAGQLSLCQYVLGGFGAWVASRLAATQGLPFELVLVIGVAATVPLGLLVALPALRTRGMNLAVATLGLAEMISAIVFNNGALTGGFGGTSVSAPHFFGINLDPIAHPASYGIFALIVFILCGLVVANLRRGRAGRRLLAVRANERAAASLGVGVYGAKLYAFGLASALAAIGGILLAFQNPSIQVTNFDIFTSINTVLYAVVGGAGWAAGALLGALQTVGGVLNTAVDDIFPSVGDLSSWLLLFSGVAVVLTLRVAPDGIASVIAAQLRTTIEKVRPTRPATLADPEPRLVRPPAVLEVEDVIVRFGGVVALDKVSFKVSPGEIVGLIGPNGAGKTTILDIITGFTKQAAGSVRLDEQPIDDLSPERRARRGMARSWQAVELFEEMTVMENLLVACDRKDSARYLIDLVKPGRLRPSESLNEAVGEFGLAQHMDKRPSDLSHGTARLVGIARAMATEPSVLLLDEPAAGLDARESAELGVAIRGISERTGAGILLVEHDVNLLMDICDRIVVLDFGRKIADGTPHQISGDKAVIAAYLGEAPEGAATELATPAAN